VTVAISGGTIASPPALTVTLFCDGGVAAAALCGASSGAAALAPNVAPATPASSPPEIKSERYRLAMCLSILSIRAPYLPGA